MPKLSPTPALGGDAARVDQIGGLRLSEITDLALASLTQRTGHAEAFATKAQHCFDTELPGPGRMSGTPDLQAFWVGPGQWMCLAPYTRPGALSARLKDAFGASASVTEQSDAWVILEVEGDPVVSLFERLFPIDISRMENGAADRSLIDHLGCFVLCLAAGSRYRVLGPRSSAGSLHHAIQQVATGLAGGKEPK